jgi:serine/threonine protein kinase
MPAPASVADFVAVVKKSGLVADDRLRTEVEHITAGTPRPATADQMAVALVRAGLITRFQARQLKAGRYKRFNLAGKYRLLELLGVGGMGAVYLCEHVFMKRLVAIKILPTEKMAEPGNVDRFYREARAVAALNDPNIVRAYDIDHAEGLHFLVMEYVDGASLQEIVARFGKFEPTRAASYIAQAANGLQHALELGLVHRDIKPGNLLLDRTGTIKILDMGLARFFNDKQDNLTAKFDDKCVLGTADYLAPEQAVSSDVDIRADIYALGGTLYFMLTGKSPAPDGTVAQKLVFHQTHEPVPVEQFRQDVPGELLVVLRKMMAKDAAERYQTPAEVAEALAPWADPHLEPPPAHEMPELCPAVIALAGYTADRVKAGSSVSRLTGIGRLALPRSGGSTARVMASAGTDLSSRVGLSAPPTQAHVPTDRTRSTVPDLPALPALVPAPTEIPDAKIDLDGPKRFAFFDVVGAVSDRAKMIWAAGIAALVTGTLVVGVYFTFFGKSKPVPPPTSAVLDGQTTADSATIAAPAARRFVGEERTVAFAVAKVGGSDGGHLFLDSMADHANPENFTVFIPAAVAKANQITLARLREQYEGKVVRVRGTIRLWQEKSVQIEVSDPGQITSGD